MKIFFFYDQMKKLGMGVSFRRPIIKLPPLHGCFIFDRKRLSPLAQPISVLIIYNIKRGEGGVGGELRGWGGAPYLVM